MEFGKEDAQKIRKERIALGWRLSDLQLASGIPKSALSRIERNDFKMSPSWESYINLIREALRDGIKDKPRLDDIRNCKIVKKFLNNDRWFVSLDPPFNGKRIIPQAHYNWLSKNPRFEDIPDGYALHHLDFNQLNDDISNVALMKKDHHIAHHLKYVQDKAENQKIKLRTPIMLGENLSIPRVSRIKSYKEQERWGLRWQQTDTITRKRVEKQITRIRDRPLRSREEAEKAKELFMRIHPSFRTGVEALKVKDLICQIHETISSEEDIEEAYNLVKEFFPQF